MNFPDIRIPQRETMTFRDELFCVDLGGDAHEIRWDYVLCRAAPTLK
jgi:hypothetical protein